jgi:hypothetical protein
VEIPIHGGRAHVAGTALANLEIASRLEGDTRDPCVEVSGRRLPARKDGNRLVARLDLSDLPEGEHRVTLRAAPDAAATSLDIVVDRTPPAILSVGIDGSPDTFTSAEAPRVLVRLADPPSAIAAVVARHGTRELIAVPPSEDDGPWTITGAAERDGPVDLRIRATDLAGNSAEIDHRFVRDRVLPRVVIPDLVEAPDGDVHPVREAIGGAIRIRVSEAVSIDALGTRHETRKAGELRLPLPPIPAAGLPVRIRVRDPARNEVEQSFTVRVVEDEIRLRTPSGADRCAVRPDRPVRLVLSGSYPLGEDKRTIRARPVSPAVGDGGKSAVPLPYEVVGADGDNRKQEIVIRTGGLSPGLHRLVVEDLAGARCAPFALAVDGTPPEVRAVRIRDSHGSRVDPGGWARTRTVAIEIDVEDLAPARIELGGVPAREDPRSGLATYSFRIQSPVEGQRLLALLLEDEAGNRSVEETVLLRTDWSAPRLTLRDPDPARLHDNVTPTVFSGACSEAPFVLRIRGIPGRETVERRITRRDFREEIQLPPGDPLELRIEAVDRAGQESDAVLRVLRVRRLRTELREAIEWTRGVRAPMRKIESGDVGFGRKVYAVREVFVDRTEVTNAAYRDFLAAADREGGHGAWCHPDEPEGWDHHPPADTWGQPGWNGDRLPVVNVAWWDAYAFARWSGRRLPSEAEWVKAAAKHEAEEELRAWPPFPGAGWRDGVLATREKTGGIGPEATDAGEDVSPAGCLHMGGNVSEWVTTTSGGPLGVRGGNWYLTRAAADVRRVATKRYDPGLRRPTVGFRCAVDGEIVRSLLEGASGGGR